MATKPTTTPTIPTLTAQSIISSTLEEINIDNRKRKKSPVLHMISDTASAIGATSRYVALTLDDLVEDKVLDNKLNAMSRLKDFEQELVSMGY